MKIFGQFTVFAAVLLMSIPAKADEVMPTSAWLVGPASLGGVDGHPPGNMPCVAVTQFSNGYTVRLSGGGGKLMAMAMDLRTDRFTARQKYDVEFSIPGAYFQILTGAAYDPRTLLFSLHKFPDFYAALKKAETLDVKIDGAVATLNLAGLNDGLTRMESCFGQARSDPAQNSGQQNSGQQNSGRQNSENPMGMQSSGIEQQQQAPAAPQNPLIAQNAGLTPMPGDAPPQSQPQQPSFPPPAAAPAPRDDTVLSLMQKAQEAQDTAARLSAKSPYAAPKADLPSPSAQGGPAGNVARSWSDPTVLRRAPDDILVQRNSGPSALAGDAARPMRWRALRGANLRDTLDIWAAGVGVRVLWNATDNFAVRQSLSFEGTFDQAANALLEQFGGQGAQPVGRIYREPGSAALVLVVDQRNSPQNPE